MTKERGIHRLYMVLRIYRRMLNEPERVFVLKDFLLNNSKNKHGFRLDREYIELLVKLGLVEKCNAVYHHGRNYRASNTTQGYRLRRDRQNV